MLMQVLTGGGGRVMPTGMCTTGRFLRNPVDVFGIVLGAVVAWSQGKGGVLWAASCRWCCVLLSYGAGISMNGRHGCSTLAACLRILVFTLVVLVTSSLYMKQAR